MKSNRDLLRTAKTFTLIEMLTVMVVIGMMLGASLPLFKTMLMGSKVDSAVRQVSTQMRHAKSYALMNRKFVALIVADENSLSPENGNCYNAVRLAVLRKIPGPDGYNLRFNSWADGFSWEYLPTGTVVQITKGAKYIDPPEGDARDAYYQGFESINSGKRPREVRALVIKPVGKPYIGQDLAAKLKVSEGAWDKDESEIIFGGSDEGSTKENAIVLNMNKVTGRIYPSYSKGDSE